MTHSLLLSVCNAARGSYNTFLGMVAQRGLLGRVEGLGYRDWNGRTEMVGDSGSPTLLSAHNSLPFQPPAH